MTADANGDELVIDRRSRERRQVFGREGSEERRSTDRRRPTPSTWTRDGVIVASAQNPPAADPPADNIRPFSPIR
jgi:hypothetical protein